MVTRFSTKWSLRFPKEDKIQQAQLLCRREENLSLCSILGSLIPQSKYHKQKGGRILCIRNQNNGSTWVTSLFVRERFVHEGYFKLLQPSFCRGCATACGDRRAWRASASWETGSTSCFLRRAAVRSSTERKVSDAQTLQEKTIFSQFLVLRGVHRNAKQNAKSHKTKSRKIRTFPSQRQMDSQPWCLRFPVMQKTTSLSQPGPLFLTDLSTHVLHFLRTWCQAWGNLRDILTVGWFACSVPRPPRAPAIYPLSSFIEHAALE